MTKLVDIMEETRAWACYDCGKCTATCPIPRAGGDYSPRRQVLDANLGRLEEIVGSDALFTCLTCGLCDSRCPANVDFIGLVQKLRELGKAHGAEPDCPHGGALQSVMRMMAGGGLKQNRTDWITGDMKVRKMKSDVFFFTGCTMYFDAYFKDFGVDTLGGTRAAVRLMNRMGVAPVVSGKERCCGHDLLWNGDRENFELLARFNVDLVKRSGAETLVTSCAECLRTWKVDYQPFLEGDALRMLHISEYLAENAADLEFKENGARRVTFQDPCRLGRHLGIYDQPREVMGALPGVELEEMGRSRQAATCCAGGPWSSCDRFAKKIQVDRLKEARATGAEVLVTSCPKCQVHFRCAMQDPNLKDELEIELRDLAEVLADSLA